MMVTLVIEKNIFNILPTEGSLPPGYANFNSELKQHVAHCLQDRCSWIALLTVT